jgi:hypothetical protein
MTANTKPKRTLLAYCALAERLNKPGAGVIQALTPFLAEACHAFSGELFDASKFSAVVAERFGIRIPRLAALGLAEHLEGEGLLAAVSGHALSTVYRYTEVAVAAADLSASAVTEAEIEGVLRSFVEHCKSDSRLSSIEEAQLHASFLDRLLNTDSMRLLSRKEGSIAARKGPATLVLNRPAAVADQRELEELHLDFVVSQYLLDLRDRSPATFDRVSDIAFANMAAEALACFNEPPTTQTTLAGLTVYLDSPLLLDMLGVNTEYAEYGTELLEAIKASGSTAAVFDHSVVEAESVVSAQLAYLRSGINQATSRWGVSAKPDLLSALINNVGERAAKRLGIEVHRDPELNLHRRAAGPVGDIEAHMTERMKAWGTVESREYDRKSVWSMLSVRDTGTPCARVCDSKRLFLARNTALVNIANTAWMTWLKGTTRHSHTHIEKWAPIGMSDKQFAGYLWLRGGGHYGSISRSRLLAHCSAAVRPRADIKARAYNLVLDLSGRKEADDVAALLEDREGARALMRVTRGDPEDVTKDRLPYILEQVKLAAGEFAAGVVRAESEKALEATRTAHAEELEDVRRRAQAIQDAKDAEAQGARLKLLQAEQDSQTLAGQNAVLQLSLEATVRAETIRLEGILQAAFLAGAARYSALRWSLVVAFASLSGLTAWLSSEQPTLAIGATVLLGVAGFWFVPEFLERPLHAAAMRRLRAVVAMKDALAPIPSARPDFRQPHWKFKLDASDQVAQLRTGSQPTVASGG